MKFVLIFLLSCSALAKPHWDQNIIPKSVFNLANEKNEDVDLLRETDKTGLEVLRIHVDWLREGRKEKYVLVAATREFSGTTALYSRCRNKDKLGSYRGELVDPTSGDIHYYSSIGTGMEYRKLTRGMSFRFPAISKPMIFRMWAENPQNGVMEIVLSETIDLAQVKTLDQQNTKQWIIKEAIQEPRLVMTFYAEGYKAGRESAFLEAVRTSEKILRSYPIPLFEHLEIRAAFSSSKTTLGRARDLGMPIPEFDSFLGLYFPYWNSDMGRWYHILYPTREQKLRDGLGQAVYDYPVILVDDSSYWGVGNYNSHTALPAGAFSSFEYLFLHEFGHFMGLNEEYHEPAPNRTELTFAPGIYEPWSQNTTFLREPENLKWKKFVKVGTEIPTNRTLNLNLVGAYKGGYSSAPGLNHKPTLNCVMDSKRKFCKVCLDGIKEKIKFDLGL